MALSTSLFCIVFFFICAVYLYDSLVRESIKSSVDFAIFKCQTFFIRFYTTLLLCRGTGNPLSKIRIYVFKVTKRITLVIVIDICTLYINKSIQYPKRVLNFHYILPDNLSLVISIMF